MQIAEKTRREFIKELAISAALVSASSLIPGILFARDQATPTLENIDWKKTPCRFCGVGCGLLVGLQAGKAVAVKGDPNSSVNKGLCCVKGYHSILALYGEDRLTKAQIRKNGKMVEVPISEALDLVALKIKETIKEHGKNAVSIYGSGQWTIPDGYCASKLFKGAIGTNNVEANARLCMASAVTGFLTTFGIDEPMGCYEDIEHSDVFILWGNNMAEMHPVLFSRMLDHRQKNPHVKIIDFATRKTRTSYASDHSIYFVPQTDLAVANAICHEIIAQNRVNQSFVDANCAFKQGKTNIGYGLEDDFKFKDELSDIDFKKYSEYLKDYSAQKVAAYSGVSISDIKLLANYYGDPSKKVTSFWCMGPNQHTRGTWINNLIYNIHLLTGKIATPGNNPFSLTGQPSACGTVREVGTLTHKLPHGVVTNQEDRELAEKIWKLPPGSIDSKPTHHTVSMFRALDRGEIKFMWIQVTNPMVTMPNLKRYRNGALKDGRFIVVSDVYPTPTTEVADVVLPSAMWIEREGFYGNSERRTQHFEKLLDPPGEAMSDTWQLIEIAKRLGYEHLFPWSEKEHIEKIWAEYRLFHDNPKHAMAPYDELKKNPGLQWPFVNGKETKRRFASKSDPACDQSREFDFYGKPDHKAWVIFRPYEPPAESPDKDFPFWLNTGRVIEHWHTGSMTRRIPILHQAMPNSYAEINPEDALELGVKNNDWIKLSSRRGEIRIRASVNGRGIPSKGQVFVPFFDESLLINELTLDAYCPISNQPDYKKCAIKVERV